MKLFRRLALVFVIVLILGGVGLYVGLRYYLSSSAAAGQVATHLQNMLGAPVQIDGVDVGVSGPSTVHGLRIYEAGDEAKQTPFVTVQGASTDASAVDLLQGKSPNEISLTGAAIALRFDDSGKLVTRLPKTQAGSAPMPRLHIENGTLTLNQSGRPPMVIQGIKADLVGDAAGLKVTGTITDPYWGDWSLDGSQGNETGAIALTLSTKKASVDKARLTSLPFVAPEVWKEVLVEGDTPCDFTLGLELKDNPTIHYRVALAPADAAVHVTSIQMDASHASGKVVVEDNLVTLRGVAGQFAGGKVGTDADLDFRGTAWKLKFSTITAEKVLVHDLPPLWIDSFKGKLDGELSGKASVEVTLDGDKYHIDGDGTGAIDKAIVAGFPASEPIQLSLVTENGRLKFRSRDSAAKIVIAFMTPAFALAAAAPPPAAPPAPPPLALPEPTPVRLLEWLPDATVWATNQAAAALGKGLSIGAGWINGKPSTEETSYLEAKLSLQDVDLGELLRRLEIKLPFPVEGKLTFQVQAGIPINTPQDIKTYRLNGTATLPRFNVAGVEMADVHASLRFDKGVLDLQELKGKAVAAKGNADAVGSFDGTARMEVAPVGDLSADVRVDHFPLAVVLNQLPGAAGKAVGSFSGHVTARAPANTLTDPATWHGSGKLNSDRIEAYGLALTAVSADVSVDGGKAKATDLKATLDKATLTGDAQLDLSTPWKYSGTLATKGVDLDAAQRLAPDFRPPFPIQGGVDVTADLHGTLSPLSVTATGTASGADLVVNQLKIDSLSFKWDINDDRVKLTDAKAKLYQGEASGSAVVPIRAAAAGEVDLRLDEVDVQALAKSIPAMPLRLQGRASGTVKANLPAAGADGERQATGKIDLSAKSLRVQNIPTDNLHADVSYQEGVANYNLKGDSLGGRFTLEGKIPFREEKKAPGGGAAPKDEDKPEAGGRFRFERIQLTRLWDALGLGTTLGQVRGRATIDLPFRLAGPNHIPTGNGTLSVRNLRIGTSLLAESLTANLVMRDQTVQVRNLSATLGEGSLRGVVAYNYHNPDRSYFNLQLDHADAGVLLAAYPDVAAEIQGPVDLHLRGNLGAEWRGSGEAALTRGRVYGVEVQEWRLPLSFTFAPAQGRGQLAIRDSNAQLARGRATGQAEITWSAAMPPRLEGNARFYNAELRSLLHSGGELGSFAVGQVTGRTEFKSDGLRSADDLNATVDATLSQSQALQIPVLRVVAPYLAPGQSATTFQNGELRGRLSRGVFRIERLNLSSTVVRMSVVGSVTTEGRLDLEVTGGTGRIGYNPGFLQLIGLRIPIAGPIPLAVILEASSYLSNRVVHLRVTGTTRSPDVRLEPVRILAEEAVRFFLLQSNVPLP